MAQGKVCLAINPTESLFKHSLLVYAYIPSPNNLCSEASIECNSDYGISISRGSFSFIRGTLVRIMLFDALILIANYTDGAESLSSFS